MKTPGSFEEQTEEVVEKLFDLFGGRGHGGGATFRNLVTYEQEQDDNFDPNIIAHRLRCLADELNEDVERQARQLISENILQKFSDAVNTLSTTWVATNPELDPGKALLQASVALAQCTVKMEPEMMAVMKSAMTAFILGSDLLRTYIESLGGWMGIEI